MLQSNRAARRQRRGSLSLEWVLLVTVLVIGIVSGLAAVRNATNGELLDLSQAIDAISVLPEEPSDESEPLDWHQ
jgi:hypothetical protein